MATAVIITSETLQETYTVQVDWWGLMLAQNGAETCLRRHCMWANAQSTSSLSSAEQTSVGHLELLGKTLKRRTKTHKDTDNFLVT
jgi:phosphopentomutase